MRTFSRVALITGCGKASGLGAAAARALAVAGVTVVVSDVAARGLTNEHDQAADSAATWNGLETLVMQIADTGGTATAITGDVSLEADTSRMVDEVMKQYGRIDILVNNAGAPHGADHNEIEDVPAAVWDQVMAINARGPFLLSQAAVPHMRREKWGRIINMSSSTAYRPRPKRFTYSASKMAVIGLTKGLAVDLAPFGITVNAICPGPVKTSRALSIARHNSGDAEAGLADKESHIPMGRHGTPEEIAAMVVFLASDSAAFITGQAIGINGGSAGSL